MTENTTNTGKNGQKVQLLFGQVAGVAPKIPLPVETENRGGGYVQFGEDNRFPQFLFSLYSDCALLQSLCNGTCDYIIGDGLTKDYGSKTNDTIARCILDYVIFGAFAIQVRRNDLGEIVSYDYVDVQRVRLDAKHEKVYYSKTWGRYAKDTRTYERYNPDAKKKVPNSIYYFATPRSRGVYGLPIWNSALKEAQTLTEISKFHLASITNGLHSPMIINFNNGTPTQEVKAEIERLINERFCGSDKAGSYMVSYNESKEHAMDIQGLPDENYDTKYLSLKENSSESLLTAFRASAQLFGISSQSTGFSSIEYRESYTLFEATMIRPLRAQLTRAFANVGLEVEFKPFTVDFDTTNNE